MAESGGKKAARGMLIGMKETRMKRVWRGRGIAACAKHPGWLLPRHSSNLRGWVGFNPCRGLVESDDRRG